MSQKSYGTITIVDTNDIARIYVVYAKSATNTDVPSAAASTWTESIANAPGSGDYIWQRTVTEQSGTHEKTYGNPVCVTGPQGGTGATGRGVSSIVTTYCNYGEGTPAASYAGWQSTVPTYDSEKPNYWVKTVITYTTGSPATDTSIYKDNGITDAIYNSAVANSIAQSANENSQGALSQSEEALQTAIQVDTLLGGHFMHGNALSQATPASARVIEQIEESGVDVSRNPSKWHHNVTIGSNGIQLRYNEVVMAQLAANNGNDTALKFYQPPTISNGVATQGALTMELSGNALTFYNPTTNNAQMIIGANGTLQSGNYSRGSDTKFAASGTKIDLTAGDIITQYFRLSQGGEAGGPGAGAYIHGAIEALNGRIGGYTDGGTTTSNYWDIGNFTDYNLQRSAKMIGHGSSFIQLGDSSTWRLATNRIHTGWYEPTQDSYLHFPEFTFDGSSTTANLRRWDYGIHVPTAHNDKFLYIRNASATGDLANLVRDLEDDAATHYWTYKFWIDGDGNVYAPNLYKWQNDNWVPVDAGGAVDSASKLTSYGGTSNRPVYFPSSGTDQGKPVQITITDNSSATAVSSTDTNLITARTLYYAGYTKNTGTVTSVQVQASSPLQSSTNTAQTSTLNTTISFANQNKNLILAGPSTGSAATPSFRALVAADIPDLSGTYLTSHQNIKTLHSKTLVGTGNVTLSASDVGALPSNTTYVSTITTTAGAHTTISSQSGAVSFKVPTHTSHLTNDSNFATTGYVDTAISGLPEPMIFKGSLGTGGTITTLPAAAASNEGFTYKVITAGTYASQSAKVGDTFISDGSAWVLIPSGDEPSGTVTSIATSSPITGGTITTSGTIGHATSGVGNTITTAGFYKFKYDTYGHVTGVTSVAKADITGLGIPGSDTHYTANLITGASASAKTDAASSNSTYLNLVENDTVRNSHQIIGSGTVSVANDANGKITITGSAHPTTLPNPKSLKLKIYSGTSTSSDTTYYGGENANTEVSVAGTAAITGISASAASGGATTFTLTKANGGTSTFDVTVTASVATGATKMTDSNGNTISEGSATNPVYFSAGVPVATTYSLNKTVPSDAVFTDTWTAMVGATSSANGSVGYVNAVPPKDGYNTKFLRADGTWVVPGGTYSLPLAANGTRGGVQIGYTQSGKNYPVQLSSEKMYVNVPWENTTYSAGTGLSLSGTTFNHSNSVTAGTAGTSSATSGSTLAVPYVTYDAQGHITGSGTHTHTITGFLTSHQTLYDENIQWGPTSTGQSGNVSPIGASLSSEHSANRIAYLNPAAIQIEYTTNGGSSWADSGYSDTEKTWLCTGNQGIAVGQSKSGYSQSTALTTNHWTRITLTGQNGTTGYVYTAPRKLLINMGTAVGVSCLVEYKTGVSGATWQTFGTYAVSGWSGWNDIPLILGTFGGGTTQTSNNWYLRFTFKVTSTRTDTYKGYSQILGLRLFGSTDWTSASSSYSKGPFSSTGHLYSYDVSANASFPAQVTATQFNGALNGTASNASKVNNLTVQTAVPANAVFTDTWKALSTSQAGYVAQAPNDTSKFLRGDATWAAVTKSNVGLGNVENTALSTWTGTNKITTLGTITTGTWNGTTIAVANGGTGATDAAGARTNLGLGTAATYAVDDATGNGALGTGTGLTTERSVYYGLVTVNGASQTRATGIYAPTSAGTNNYVLKSNGNGAPSWTSAVLTDEKVAQTATSDDKTYEILFSGTNDNTTRTEGARKTNTLTYNPSTKTLTTTNIVASYLKATDAKITNILEANEVHTNKWTAANIANIGGSFYISPTMESDVAIDAISVTSDVYTFKVKNGTFSTTAANVSWNVGSRVMATGTVTKGGVEYPIGTIIGILYAISTTGFTINNIASSNKGTLDKIIAAGGSYGTSHVKISMYQIGDGNASSASFKPVGIYLTSYGADTGNGNTKDTSLDTFIDIYGGTNNIGTNAGMGGADPNVRLGYLGHLDSYTDSAGNTHQPQGWGLYTENGYFKGVLVADSGSIGKFTINSKAIYSGTHDTWNKASTNGIFIGTNDTNYYVSGGPGANWWIRDDGQFQFGGSNGITYNGTTLSIPAANVSGTLTAATMETNLLTALNTKISALTATTATIGSWTISKGVMQHATVGGSGGVWISADTDTSSNVTVGNSGAIKTWRLLINNTFGVTTAGKLYASGADITGAILATSFTAKDSNDKTRATVDANGLKVYDTDGTTEVAQFGSTLRLGIEAADKYNILITTNGIQNRKNTSVLSQFDSSSIKFYDGSGTASSNILADFGSSATVIGKTTDTNGNIRLVPTSGFYIRQGSKNIISTYYIDQTTKTKYKYLYWNTCADNSGTLQTQTITSTIDLISATVSSAKKINIQIYGRGYYEDTSAVINYSTNLSSATSTSISLTTTLDGSSRTIATGTVAYNSTTKLVTVTLTGSSTTYTGYITYVKIAYYPTNSAIPYLRLGNNTINYYSDTDSTGTTITNYYSFVIGDSYSSSNKNMFSINNDGDVITTGQITAKDGFISESHNSPIGTIVEGKARVSLAVAHESAKFLAKITLSAGTWIIIGTMRIPSNSTRGKAIRLNIDSVKDAGWLGIQQEIFPVQTYIRYPVIVTPTEETAYYFNAWQNTGSTISIIDVSLKAVRIC